MRSYRVGLALVVVVLGLICWFGVYRPSVAPGAPGQQHLEVWTIALKPKFTVYMEGLFREFEKANPSVKINWIDLPQQNIMQKLMASIAGGVPPDVVNLTTGNALFLAQNMSLAPISQYVNAQEAEQYYPGLWNSASLNGQIYAVPWYVSARVLIFNRQLLQEAGWPMQRAPRSRSKVAELAAAIKKHKPQSWGYYPVVRIMDDWRLANLPIYDKHTGRALFREKPYVQALEWYVQLYKRQLLPAEFLLDGYQGALERYKQGNLALLEAGPQLLLQIKADAPQVYAQTDIAPLPWSKEGKVPAALMNLAVPQSSPNKELAVKLALFITNWQNQLKFAQEVPLLTSTWRSTQDPFFSKSNGDPLQDKAVRVSLKQLPKANDFSLSLPHARDLERLLNKAVESAIYGDKSSQKALNEAAEAWDKIIEASGYGDNHE